jgi:endonuclease YncB( thermonuclease family)
MIRRVSATVLTPSKLLVDHGFGSFVARDVIVEPALPAVGTQVLFETSHCSRRATKGRLLKLIPNVQGPTFFYEAVIGRVVDGDTLWLDVDTWAGPPDFQRILVRIDGINCPESHGPKASPEGLAAAAFTLGLLPAGTCVVVTTRKVDARLLGHGEKVEVHGRYLASITLPNGRDLAATLIAAGHAVEYHGEGRV